MPGIEFAGNPVIFVRATFAPGTTVAPRNTAGFGLQIRRRDGGLYFQPSHHSYRDYHWPSDWKRVGLYNNGKLVWGTELATYLAQERAKQLAIKARLLKKE